MSLHVEAGTTRGDSARRFYETLGYRRGTRNTWEATGEVVPRELHRPGDGGGDASVAVPTSALPDAKCVHAEPGDDVFGLAAAVRRVTRGRRLTLLVRRIPERERRAAEAAALAATFAASSPSLRER